jgi:hypothetical protein
MKKKQFEIMCWALYFNVYEFIAKNGELLAYENYPQPIVDCFVKWINKNK